MTAIRRFKALLEDEWQVSRPGRAVDVPEPDVFIERNRKKASLRTSDYVVVMDGGSEDLTPGGFGWTHENVKTRLEFDVRSADRRDAGSRVESHVRMFGYINDTGSTDEHGLAPGEEEDHGGLVGEIRKIMSDNRKGLGPYDRVTVREVNDKRNTVQKNKSRAGFNVELEKIASGVP